MTPLYVLVACEESGIVRDAFIRGGHFAVSCDLSPSRSPGPHYQGDALDLIGGEFDLMIAHPPCTYLCSSGLHWNRRRPERAEETEKALDFVRRLFASKIKGKAIENPRGCIGTRIRPATQTIQPHEYGHDASKATCLWLENLPLLIPTKHIAPRIVIHNGRQVKRWANQTDSGQNRLGPSADRARLRSETYHGIADAMVQQWGAL